MIKKEIIFIHCVSSKSGVFKHIQRGWKDFIQPLYKRYFKRRIILDRGNNSS